MSGGRLLNGLFALACATYLVHAATAGQVDTFWFGVVTLAGLIYLRRLVLDE